MLAPGYYYRPTEHSAWRPISHQQYDVMVMNFDMFPKCYVCGTALMYIQPTPPPGTWESFLNDAGMDKPF